MFTVVSRINLSHDVSRWRGALSSCHPSIAFYEEPPSPLANTPIQYRYIPRQLDNFCSAFFDYSPHSRDRSIRLCSKISSGSHVRYRERLRARRFAGHIPRRGIMSLIESLSSISRNAIRDCISRFGNFEKWTIKEQLSLLDVCRSSF